jgi:catechol 2,3-dioxygenase-like lactoylglutathione lyase family enzyme
MQINGLNHINIVAADLAKTVAFYESVLGMKAQPIPGAPPGFDGRWIFDSQGNPVIHVQAYNAGRHGAINSGLTGAIDHVSLTCVGFADIKTRCAALGVDYRVSDRQYGDLRQMFITDPDNISLELNFAGE